jgi:hypothetical protein
MSLPVADGGVFRGTEDVTGLDRVPAQTIANRAERQMKGKKAEENKDVSPRLFISLLKRMDGPTLPYSAPST